MKRIIFLVVTILVIAPQFAIAQIEVDANGNVSAGNTTPVSTTTLFIQGGSSNYVGIETRSENTGSKRYGIIARAVSGPTNNYAVWAKAIGGSGTNYGIYAYGGGAGTNYAGFFDGNVYATGTITSSDGNLKENIVTLDGTSVLEKLMRLRPTSFNYRRSGIYEVMNLNAGLQYGLVAQEVESVFPELVSDNIHPASIDESGKETGEPILFKGMNYNALIPLLLKAIQEQQAEIDALKSALRANGIQVNR